MGEPSSPSKPALGRFLWRRAVRLLWSILDYVVQGPSLFNSALLPVAVGSGEGSLFPQLKEKDCIVCQGPSHSPVL